MFKRRRSLIIKIVLAIPLLWFCFIGISVVFNGESLNVIRKNSALNVEKLTVNTLKNKELNELSFEERVKRAQILVHQRELEANGEAVEEGPNDGIHTQDLNAPGEQGKAVNIVKENLVPEERIKFDKGWEENAFNNYASDKISVHRTLPDVRDKACRNLVYPKFRMDTSVIICFHNEAWSVLFRTVHSVLDRSPPEMLKEIILVDDFSDKAYLAEPLKKYILDYPKIKVVRAKRREGLIRARLLGASVASGDVLTYLDSHCECARGWLEPLMSRISENMSNVVTPVIDVIDDGTLRYQYSSAASTSVGGFDWNLQFNWHPIPEREKNRRKNDIDPVHSPTMAGGLFSIHREYFERLGTYDPGMDIWGGENLEISFRIWMCGGTLEVIPCSHVGHIFRKRSPYKWKTGVNVVKKNSIRLAEVWMDEYKTYYYERFNNDLGEFGDITGRKKLRQKLQCKSFKWYVQNVYPELFVPGDAIASGEVRNRADTQCLDAATDQNAMHKPVKMWPCHKQGGNQYWMLSKSGEIRRDEGCMDYSGSKDIIIYPCHNQGGNQEWVYGEDLTIKHKSTGSCMHLTAENHLSMQICDPSVPNQKWDWKRKS